MHLLLVSKAEKLKEKIMSGRSDRNITFQDAVTFLKHEGFVLVHGEGSHHFFRHPITRNVVNIPRHGKEIKPIYVKKIREALQ